MKKVRWKSMLAFVLAFMLVISAVPVIQVNASETGDEISVSGNGIENQGTEDEMDESSDEVSNSETDSKE